jgi:exopolysaccharide biosynthesis polyprenyl glycosylphosphotransferase
MTEISLVWGLIYLAIAMWMPDPEPDIFAGRFDPLRALPPVGCLFVSFYYWDLYDIRIVKNFKYFVLALPKSLLVSLPFLVGVYALFPSFRPYQGVVASSSCSLVIAIVAVILFRFVLYALLKNKLFVERILILGTGSLAQKVAGEIEMASPLGYIILGFVDENNSVGSSLASPVLSKVVGSLESFGKTITEQRPDCIIVALRERRGRLPLQGLLDAHIAGVVVEDGIRVHERLSGKLAIENLTPSVLLFSTDFKKPLFSRVMRRIVNFAVAAIGLVLTAPLMMLIIILIWLDSKRTIFFVQERAGLNKKIFPLFKFCTMYPIQTKDPVESAWNRDVTSRVTRVGKWLRRYHLDELPQLINVLRGDMDLVGPRPEIASNIAEMLTQIPYYALRMTVRPGMTGWAQVRYGYAVSQEDVTEKLRYDLYYVKHMSLWLDLRILFDTMKIVFSWRGDRTQEGSAGAPGVSRTGAAAPSGAGSNFDSVRVESSETW